MIIILINDSDQLQKVIFNEIYKKYKAIYSYAIDLFASSSIRT